MPFKSQAQRRLMYAADKKGGAGGVSQAVAEKFVADDKPGKLPERVGTRASRLYKPKKMES